RLPSSAPAEEYAFQVRKHYPDDPEMAQVPALRALLAGRWAEVDRLLSAIDPSPLRDAAARHHDHLLGVALLMLDKIDEARRVLARGASRTGGSCDLSIPLALAGLPGGPSPSPLHATVHALDRAVREADTRLALGDPARARKALSSLVVREAC